MSIKKVSRRELISQLDELCPEFWHDLVPIAQAHGVSLAIDNVGNDSDGASFAIMIVTPETDPKRPFQGPKLEVEMTEDDEGRLEWPDGSIESVSAFLAANHVAAVVSLGEPEGAFSPEDYVRLVVAMSEE